MKNIAKRKKKLTYFWHLSQRTCILQYAFIKDVHVIN